MLTSRYLKTPGSLPSLNLHFIFWCLLSHIGIHIFTVFLLYIFTDIDHNLGKNKSMGKNTSIKITKGICIAHGHRQQYGEGQGEG